MLLPQRSLGSTLKNHMRKKKKNFTSFGQPTRLIMAIVSDGGCILHVVTASLSNNHYLVM